LKAPKQPHLKEIKQPHHKSKIGPFVGAEISVILILRVKTALERTKIAPHNSKNGPLIVAEIGFILMGQKQLH
jgi:hypothetical protein